MSVNLKDYVNQYDFPFTIPSTGEVVKFKPITTGQMKKLLVYEEESVTTVEKILDDIITGCVMTESFDIDDITLQDRFNLLIEIRKKSKGNEYNFQTKCSECKTLGPKSISLDELENVPFNGEVNKTIELTDKMSIEVDFVKRRSQKVASEIIDKMKDLNQTQQLAQLASYTYALSITKFITPDGEYLQDDINVEDVIDMMDSLDERTYKKLSDWYENTDYGIVFKADHKCGNCGAKSSIDIPISYFFS